MNPKVWATKQKRFTFSMAKLTREQKIEIYYKRKSGITIPTLFKELGIRGDNINYLIRLIDKHGKRF